MILATTLNSIMKQHNVNENSGFVEERLIYRELNPSLKAAEAHTHPSLSLMPELQTEEESMQSRLPCIKNILKQKQLGEGVTGRQLLCRQN